MTSHKILQVLPGNDVTGKKKKERKREEKKEKFVFQGKNGLMTSSNLWKRSAGVSLEMTINGTRRSRRQEEEELSRGLRRTQRGSSGRSRCFSSFFWFFVVWGAFWLME